MLIILLQLLLTTESQASVKVIYGQDNRKDLFQTSNPLHRTLAISTAAMIEKRRINKTTEDYTLMFNRTLETAMNVCPSEKFSEQTVGSTCSGFLVGDDTIVTAGHCLLLLADMGYPTQESVCRGFSWVFDFAVDTPERNVTQGFSSNNVYNCKQVITAQLDDKLDLAVIKLDRKVVGREPLKFRRGGKVPSNASLVVIGHPSGLPTKISDGAKILDNSQKETFVTNLDTFQGNSGSAVFDAQTGLVEGILVQGKIDYRPSNPRNFRSCIVVNVCDENGNSCEEDDSRYPAGEVVTRITEVLDYL